MDVSLPLTTRDGAGGLEDVAAVAYLHGSRLVLRRRLAGLVLVELRLEIDSLELPDPVRRAHAQGRRVRAHVDCEAAARSTAARPVAAEALLVREAPRRLSLERLLEDGSVGLGSQYVLPAVEGDGARIDAHVTVKVGVPRYVVAPRGHATDAVLSGGPLLHERLRLRLDRRAGELPVLRHAAVGARVLNVADHSEVVDPRAGLVEYRVPVGSATLRGRLVVRVLPLP